MAKNTMITVKAAVMAVVAAAAAAAAIGADAYYYQPPAPAYQGSEWQSGSATFYGDPSGLGADFGGACGYSACDIQSLYSTRTAALSTPLFAKGNGCGQCYELRCSGSRWCNPGSPTVVVTGTNLCPPNWALPSNDGGWCNPPRRHFDMAFPSFQVLAPRVAGIVPVQFRRVPCQREGGVRFCPQGNAYWLLVYVMNVAGAGDVSGVMVKGQSTDWIAATHNWGITFQVFAALGGQALAVKLTGYTSPEKTIIVDDAISYGWTAGLCYQGSNNFY